MTSPGFEERPTDRADINVRADMALMYLASRFGQLSGNDFGQSYAHPDRWDGHSIGIGEVVPRPRLVAPSPGTMKFVGATLTQHLQKTGGGMALGSFRTGDELAIDREAPGSVFAYQMETLVAYPGLKMKWNDTDWKAVRPAPPAVMGQDEWFNLFPLPFYYSSFHMLGTVARHRNTPTLLAWPRAYIGNILDSSLSNRRKVTVQHSGTLVVGEVAHYDGFRDSGEKIQRIVAVDRLTPAQPAKRPKQWFAWMGRTANQGA